MNDYVRKLASVQKIVSVTPIVDADKICQYGVLGWSVVDRIGEYQVGDLIFFLEVDSFVPYTLAPLLSKGKEPREYMGIRGERLRTVKLRKTLSQGLILPLSVLEDKEFDLAEGSDVSLPLGIIKWEPSPEHISGDTKGNFPPFIPKTDQPRIQNIMVEVVQKSEEGTFQRTEKIDGQSSTIYFNNGVFGVASRNLELKGTFFVPLTEPEFVAHVGQLIGHQIAIDSKTYKVASKPYDNFGVFGVDVESDNTYWKVARKYSLHEKLPKLGRNIAIQGEQCGPGIQGNRYGLSDHMLFVFDIFDIDSQKYLSPKEAQIMIKELGLVSVPVLKSECSFENPELKMFLESADGISVCGVTTTLREGDVYKSNSDERFSFKVISNKFLLNEK